MLRYIDADWLLERAVPIGWSTPKWVSDIVIEDAPTIDAVEVVRCKDCKWFGKVGCAIMIVDDYDKPTEDDYCSFAERRDDGKG